MTPRTVLILCERAPVKTNPVPAVRYGEARDRWWLPAAEQIRKPLWECSYCGRRVQVVA